jgi:minor extracellular serine protease Vpr
MQFRAVRRLAAVAAVCGALAPPNSGAARPEPVAGGSRPITPAQLPIGLGKQAVTVVVELTGDPVAVQQGNAGRKLTRAERDAIKAQLRGPQSNVISNVQGMGGTVLGNYQSAYNGVKVRVASDKIQQIAALPGVLAVRPTRPIQRSNVHGVPVINAPAVWQNLGLHGEGVKIGIIDTGIDYTHANFGGPGTVAAYNAAYAADKLPADPALFGPNAPRVKGGIDLVGDDYDADSTAATYQPIPHPDPNPLDCSIAAGGGHGSHVAGSAAGSGVLASGATFTGSYNATTISGNNWTVGPGVAPKAELYAIRVFGCNGSTDVVVDAIEWAVDNDLDVINLSLGSSFGTRDSPDSIAVTNAAKAGVIVVVSAGNNGPAPYILGSPASADGAITVAASDPTETFAGALGTLNTGGAAIGVKSLNDVAFGSNYSIVVLRNANGTVSLGCNPAEYAGTAGKLVVVQRGDCARVARAVYGQQAGAAAVALIDTSTGYPPFEGQITSNPDTGQAYTVTIPFLGVRGLAGTAGADGNRLAAAASVALLAANVPNPAYLGYASFTSDGPRGGDSFLKPDITAPGVSIVSTGSGTGNGSEALSGTSMAAPHVTGVAALTRQAHPNWKVAQIKAAIVNTGDPAQVSGFRLSRGGTGLVQPAKSTLSQVVALADDGRLATALNFGFQEVSRDFRDAKSIVLRNFSSTPATFNVAQARAAGVPHALGLNRTVVTVPPRGTAEVDVTLTVPVATVGRAGFHEVAGIVEFTPAAPAVNSGVALRVPYYLVPNALSDVSTSIGYLKGSNPSTTAKVTNRHGAVAGDADFYAWGLSDRRDPGRLSNDVRAVGVQSFPAGADAFVAFAINTFDRWSNVCSNEFDIFVDVDGDGIDDYVVIGVDSGRVLAGTDNGQMASFVFSLRPASTYGVLAYTALAPTDSSTVLLGVDASMLCAPGEPCLSAANPRIAYHVVAYDGNTGSADVVPGVAKYNVWSSAISQGGFTTVVPGATDTSVGISVNSAEWAKTPAKGLMIVTHDNKSGADEAQLIEVKVGK